jgi:hypothetical protein
MESSQSDNPKPDKGSKTRWPLWLSVVLLSASLGLCVISYVGLPLLTYRLGVTLYWFAVSFNRFILVTIFGAIIIAISIFKVIIPLGKIPKTLSPKSRTIIISISSLTLLFACLNISYVYFIWLFAAFDHLDSANFKGYVYHLTVDEDVDVHYSYMLCQCEASGNLCQCATFYSSKIPHDTSSIKLGIDLDRNILQVKFEGELLYEYDGKIGKCYGSKLAGICLSNLEFR